MKMFIASILFIRSYMKLIISDIIEPQREKKYLLTCALNEDSNQPAYLQGNFAFLAVQNVPNKHLLSQMRSLI